MEDETLEKIARIIAVTIQREESAIIRKKREDRAEAEAIYAAYEANPTPETLKGLISLNERAHEHAKTAQLQLDNLTRMATDLERIIQNLEQKEKAAQAAAQAQGKKGKKDKYGCMELASALSAERRTYEHSCSMTEKQQELSRETMEQVILAVQRSDAMLEREKARVAALFLPKESGKDELGETRD